jgi:hypothetical protein
LDDAQPGTIADLARKVAFLREHDWWEDEPTSLIADVLRMAGAA